MASSLNSRKPSEIFTAQSQLYKHMYAFIDTMCLKWCTEMNIPNIIHNHGQPISLSNLVSTLQIPSSKFGNVQRLMRYLAHNGLIEIVKNQELEEAYALTVTSELLVKGTKFCLAPLVESYLNPEAIDYFNQLNKWICEEDVTLGSGFWEFLNTNPERNRSFIEAMASDTKIIKLAMKDCNLVFEGLESIVDVGGGNGTMGKIITETFPKLKYVVFDRPEVVENLSGNNNLTYVSGDMFISIPRADAALLKYILHDWTDKDCIKILKKCKEAITSDEKRGKLIIIEVVINEKKDNIQITQLKLQIDIFISSINGKERNEEEWKKLFVEAGFKDYKISPLTGLLSLIEVYP
ncbi:unnamed protein product [Lathyrus sativus]|nr:unnamed protein product [Lathyrus sativus]